VNRNIVLRHLGPISNVVPGSEYAVLYRPTCTALSCSHWNIASQKSQESTNFALQNYYFSPSSSIILDSLARRAKRFLYAVHKSFLGSECAVLHRSACTALIGAMQNSAISSSEKYRVEFSIRYLGLLSQPRNRYYRCVPLPFLKFLFSPT